MMYSCIPIHGRGKSPYSLSCPEKFAIRSISSQFPREDGREKMVVITISLEVLAILVVSTFH